MLINIFVFLLIFVLHTKLPVEEILGFQNLRLTLKKLCLNIFVCPFIKSYKFSGNGTCQNLLGFFEIHNLEMPFKKNVEIFLIICLLFDRNSFNLIFN